MLITAGNHAVHSYRTLTNFSAPWPHEASMMSVLRDVIKDPRLTYLNSKVA